MMRHHTNALRLLPRVAKHERGRGNATQEPADHSWPGAAEDTSAPWVCAAIGHAVHTPDAFPRIPWGCLHPEASLPYGLSVSSGSWWASQLACQRGGSATPFHVDVSRDSTFSAWYPRPCRSPCPVMIGRWIQRRPLHARASGVSEVYGTVFAEPVYTELIP